MKVNRQEARERIDKREQFEGSNTAGAWLYEEHNPGRYEPLVGSPLGRHMLEATGEMYVVWSYRTPIAWFANGVWHKPEIRYSVTTSRHQGLVPVTECETCLAMR